MSSFTSFRFVEDFVSSAEPLFRPFRLCSCSSDDGLTQSTIFRFGVISSGLFGLLSLLRSTKALLGGFCCSGEAVSIADGLGVVFSHFSKISLEFLGVAEGVAVFGDSK